MVPEEKVLLLHTEQLLLVNPEPAGQVRQAPVDELQVEHDAEQFLQVPLPESANVPAAQAEQFPLTKPKLASHIRQFPVVATHEEQFE